MAEGGGIACWIAPRDVKAGALYADAIVRAISSAKAFVLVLSESAHVLAFMSFPKAHRTQIHSANPLERLDAAIKRRTDVVGIFPNEAAVTHLVGALLPSKTTNGSRSVATWPLSPCEPSSTISPLGCPPWSTEHESK